MNKLFTKIVGVALGLTMAIGLGVAVGSNVKEATPVHAVDEVFYTLEPAKGSNNSYTGNCDVTINGITWNLTGNSQQIPWRIGGKSLNKVDRTVYSKTSMGAVITKIELETGTASSCTVHSIKLEVGNSNFSEITDSVTKSSNLTSTTLTYSPNSGKTWASGSYYRFTFNVSVSGTSNKFVQFVGANFYHNASTPLTEITLSGTEVGGTSPNYTLSNIAKSDTSTDHTVSVDLTPNTATDQKVKVEHYDGDSVVDVYSSTVTCTSGTGSFNVRAKGTAVGTERLMIYGNTETSVVRYLSVTVYDDSVTNWTVSFDSDGGASIADMIVEDGETFKFPSPGTKDHYSFDGWSSDGGNTLYDAGDESPAVGDDIEYTAYWTQDAQTTVIYKSGDGTGSDISSTEYAGSYSLASFPGTWTAPSGKAFSKWSDGSSQYSAGANYTLVGNTTVTFTAVYKAVDEYTLFSGDLVEGDYVIYSDGAALKNSIASSRAEYTSVSPSNNKIIDPDSSIVWSIQKSGKSWLVVSKDDGKYLAGNGTKNQIGLFDDTSADRTWSITGPTDGAYSLVSNRNNSASVNDTLRRNGTYGFACYGSGTGTGISLYKAPSNELSSIALSGDYETPFASGDTFSFDGTVTASYTLDDPADVTSSTTFHLDSADGTNMSGVTMTHAAHDGHTIYAKYTEGGITKTATYSISVANAPVSSLTLASSTGKVATTELFDMSEIGVTILPADAVKTYEWTVLSNTVNNEYTFEADIVKAGNTEGTITLKCTSTADSSKYQTFVLTVSGNPVVTLPNSVTLYTGKTTTVTASVEGGTSPYSYSWSITSGGSYASISSGESSATVTLSGTASGSVTLQCSVTDSNSKSDSASVTFSVTASAVTEVNWSASAFDVFSGATIPANIDDTWEVNYKKNNGDADYLTFGDYELYLGSKEITSLPYTFVAEDDGESLHVEYGGISSSSVAVAVTQTINNIVADVTSETTTTFTSKAFADANNGWTSNKKEGNGFTSGQGIQVTTGTTGAGATSKSSFSNVYEIVVTYNTNKKQGEGSIDITVGSNSKVNKSVAYSGSDDGTSANFTETWTYSTKQSGTVTIVVNTTTNSIWLKAITIKTSSGLANIANNASHKDAQRVAVKFANAFNDAMDETENCTTGLDEAWAKCASAYNTFKTEAADLGSDEEAYAKNLIKYATAQYSDDSGEACIERMMKTYEICVQKHGQTAFMSELVSLSAARVTPLANIVGNGNTVAIIVVISMISITCIGGYFFLRKRKEN